MGGLKWQCSTIFSSFYFVVSSLQHCSELQVNINPVFYDGDEIV